MVAIKEKGSQKPACGQAAAREMDPRDVFGPGRAKQEARKREALPGFMPPDSMALKRGSAGWRAAALAGATKEGKADIAAALQDEAEARQAAHESSSLTGTGGKAAAAAGAIAAVTAFALAASMPVIAVTFLAVTGAGIMVNELFALSMYSRASARVDDACESALRGSGL